MAAIIYLSLLKDVRVCKCQWMRAILSNYISTLEMSCSSHLTLLHYLNWWTPETTGPSPVSWPALEPLFMLPVKKKKGVGVGWGGVTDLMRCWDITLHLHQAAPSLWTREWFEPVERVTAPLPVHRARRNSWLPKPNGRQVSGGDEGGWGRGIKDGKKDGQKIL